MAISKKKQMMEALEEQLKKQGKDTCFFKDLISDYMKLWDTKNKLFKNIKDDGITISTVNGNGFTVRKQNESVANVLKVNNQMLKILNDLGLQEPVIKEANDDDAYLR